MGERVVTPAENIDPQQLEAFVEKTLMNPQLSEKMRAALKELKNSYWQVIGASSNVKQLQKAFYTLAKEILSAMSHPHSFDIFHRAVRHPFDYYQLGLDFIRPCIDFSRSNVKGVDTLHQIEEQLHRGDNVFFLANHQIEPDPQVISLMLEKQFPKLAEEMIFIAGHRVITDPIAIPMSLGRNLLCIYSKKYISHPVEEKEKKMLHNRRTITKMVELLKEGGKCIYVAPSGGRDRPSPNGIVEVARFDPQSIELFILSANQSGRKTHFYPMALHSYPLMPPPDQVKKELGEERIVQKTPIFLEIGQELEIEHFPESDSLDKKAKRQARADYIWGKVKQMYSEFTVL